MKFLVLIFVCFAAVYADNYDSNCQRVIDRSVKECASANRIYEDPRAVNDFCTNEQYRGFSDCLLGRYQTEEFRVCSVDKRKDDLYDCQRAYSQNCAVLNCVRSKRSRSLL